MGTRHLTCVINEGEVKVAQYGQWDGYPTGQGITIANFIQNKLNLDKFRNQIKECVFVDGNKINSYWKNCGADDSGYVTMDISKTFRINYPQLSRDTGAEVLNLIHNGTARELENEFSFGGDSLFCEFAYIIDLDTETVSIYKGFNQEDTETDNPFKKYVDPNEKYKEVKLNVIVPFSECTTQFMENLEEVIYEEDNE